MSKVSRLASISYELNIDKENKLKKITSYLFNGIPFSRYGDNRIIKGNEVIESHIWAIIDAIKRPDIAILLDIFETEHCCLWKGKSAENYSYYAPYLVKLNLEHPFTNWLFDNSIGNPIGIYLCSRLSLKELSHQLRKFNQVFDEEKNSWLMFRYYDPLTVKKLLPYLPVKDYIQFMNNILFILADDIRANQFLILQ